MQEGADQGLSIGAVPSGSFQGWRTSHAFSLLATPADDGAGSSPRGGSRALTPTFKAFLEDLVRIPQPPWKSSSRGKSQRNNMEDVPEPGKWPVDPQQDQEIQKERLWVDGCFDFTHHGTRYTLPNAPGLV